MASTLADLAREFFAGWYGQAPASIWILALSLVSFTIVSLLYALVFIAAPLPRTPLDSETKFITVTHDGTVTKPQKLPCWHDVYLAQKLRESASAKEDPLVEKAEVFVSVIVPAYNEELRLGKMLAEATEYLEREFTAKTSSQLSQQPKKRKATSEIELHDKATTSLSGWEILLVSDGSTDKTNNVALDFARRYPGGLVRVIDLIRNRGKGGAVTHGMRHARGEYVVFADADGASKFEDLGKLVRKCQEAEDNQGRAVAVGSRAHLVGSEAVVKRSKLRNFLMHSFHLLLRLLTPPATSKIKDTQCGFKLFSRASLPYIVPNMHSEGWIFDVEMLMLAESANIPIVEVQIGWKEVKGSKLNVLWDSLGMAWGLAVLRAAWAVGVYQVE